MQERITEELDALKKQYQQLLADEQQLNESMNALTERYNATMLMKIKVETSIQTLEKLQSNPVGVPGQAGAIKRAQKRKSAR